MTAERGIAAVEADLVRHVSLLYAPPFGEVHEDSGSVWVATGIADPGANGVLRAVIEGDPDERVTLLMQPFKTRSLPTHSPAEAARQPQPSSWRRASSIPK